MSRVREEINACLREPRIEPDGRWTARIAFPDDFVGFQGHFPERPVVPGVCIIEAALALYRRLGSAPVRLREVVSVKFAAMVGCREDLDLECREVLAEGDRRRLKAVLRRGGETVARMDLWVERDDPA